MLDVQVPSGSSAVLLAHGDAGEALRAWKAAQAGHVDEVDEAGLKALSEGSVDAVVVATASGQTDVEALATAAARALRAGAPLVMVGPQSEHDQLSLAAMMAGLVERSTATEGETVHVRADKPGFEAGASARLPTASASKPAANGATVWKLMADDSADVELEDEDALLETDIVAPRPKAEACAPTRKPCANCSCGRADAEASQRKEAAVTSGSSGCGSCGKGDAFRCASCPFLGAPPFKAGEAPMLDTDVQDV